MGQIVSGYGSQFLILVNIFFERFVTPHGSYDNAAVRSGHCEIKAISVMK